MQRRISLLFAAAVLVIGLAIGFGGAILGYRYGVLPMPGERPFQRMARVLELNPAQREQIRAVMHDTHGKIEAARTAFEQQRHAIFFSAYLRIHALLTPSQQRVFDARFVPPSIRAEARERQHAKATATASPSPGVN
ncbi:MAG TPA: periplasmic heavy metal sensor [Candidatus Binataceae bacterium]|nr:periplasmic heavy metal sensor [Candidatus Binataceae bacterium]